MPSSLLLVIPSVTKIVDGTVEVEEHFSYYLRGYLEGFDQVTFACPLLPANSQFTTPTLPLQDFLDGGRLSYLQLPYAYREDRYIRYYFQTKRLLRSEIAKADYLVFCPHAKYDWSMLAVFIAMQLNRPYEIEVPWFHEVVSRLDLSHMRPGIKKIRKWLWMRSFSRDIQKCFRHSTVALLLGEDVFNGYKEFAPNPHKILNVQISTQDHISTAEMEKKLTKIRNDTPLTISYAGQMIEMKGPIDWVHALHEAADAGAKFNAAWYGDGSLMPAMRDEVTRLQLNDRIALPGIVGREEVVNAFRGTEIFLFCHKGAEGPRCLIEAIASGCLILGYDSAYPRDLVAARGGGLFVERGDWKALARFIVSLDRDRSRLASLVSAAAESGRLFDRDNAIQRRIGLIKKYLAQ
jgi:glycosyltransferase involved in cell wall biosynthesis